MSRFYNKADLIGGRPVFLLEIAWGGVSYFFGSEAIQIDSSDGIKEYTPDLLDFQFMESADFNDINLEANLLSCAVIFPETINILQEWARGNFIENARANFSYVIIKDGSVLNTYDDRIILFNGTVQEPIVGDPDELDNFVALSVELDAVDQNIKLLDPALVIDSRFPSRDKETAEGKPWPLIFGLPGYTIDVTGNTTSFKAMPAYCIKRYSVGVDAEFLISTGTIENTQVTIQDSNFQVVTKTVETAADTDNNIYSFISVANTDGLDLPGYFREGSTNEWWISYNPANGGGMLSPYTEGSLSGAGDICRYVLSRLNVDIDDGAWANLSALLNKYRFAGYVNDSTVGAYEWLVGNILSYLPITIISGPDGLKPILNQLAYIGTLDPVMSITLDADSEFEQLDAIETMNSSSDLTNRITIKYAKNGLNQEYTHQIRVTDVAEKLTDIESIYSINSINKYGVQTESIETDYIYNTSTAQAIGLDIVRQRSVLQRMFSIVGSFQYGNLQIGDILQLSSNRLYLNKVKMMIVEKEWTGTQWRFSRLFEENSVINQG